MEFINENYTDVLMDLKNEFILIPDIIFDGSGEGSGEITELSTYSTLTSKEINFLNSTQTNIVIELITSSSFLPVSEIITAQTEIDTTSAAQTQIDTTSETITSSTSTIEDSETSVKFSVSPHSLPIVHTDPMLRLTSTSSLNFTTDLTEQISESSNSVEYSPLSTSVSTTSEETASFQMITTPMNTISTSSTVFGTIIITSYFPTTNTSTTITTETTTTTITESTTSTSTTTTESTTSTSTTTTTESTTSTSTTTTESTTSTSTTTTTESTTSTSTTTTTESTTSTSTTTTESTTSTTTTTESTTSTSTTTTESTTSTTTTTESTTSTTTTTESTTSTSTTTTESTTSTSTTTTTESSTSPSTTTTEYTTSTSTTTTTESTTSPSTTTTESTTSTSTTTTTESTTSTSTTTTESTTSTTTTTESTTSTTTTTESTTSTSTTTTESTTSTSTTTTESTTSTTTTTESTTSTSTTTTTESTTSTTTTTESTTSTTTTTESTTSTTTTTESTTSTSTTTTTTESTTSTSTTTTTESTTSTSTTTTESTTSTTTTTETTTSTTTTATTTLYDPNTCRNATHILVNNRCETKVNAKKTAVGTLRDNSNNAIVLANALSLYINSLTYSNIETDPSDTLRPKQVDDIVGKLNGSINTTTTESFIMAQQLKQEGNLTVFGASFQRSIGGKIVNNIKDEINNPSISIGALISNQSLVGVTSLNMLIIDKPITYEKLGDSDQTKLASSVIVMTVQRNNSLSNLTHISLYFQVLKEYEPSFNPKYSCSYYDTDTLKWSDLKCTIPKYNTQFNRYECSCNHLSTYALVWSHNIISCDNTTHTTWTNGTCISKADAQRLAAGTLYNSTNPTDIADLLSVYISSISNSNISSNSTNVLSLGEIDRQLSRIDNVNLTRNTTDSFLMVQQLSQGGNVIVLGALFRRGIGGELVHNNNKDDVTNSNISTAAVVSRESLIGVTSLNMLIIGDPTAYRNIDNSTNRTLASSVIVVAAQRNNSPSVRENISLYFQVLNEYKVNLEDHYYCSFYDINHLRWNESGCTKPVYNTRFDRFECSCDHFTSFALLFLPNVPLTTYLNAQDIASLVFQSISIVCFLLIITHAVIIRLRDPLMSLRAYDLLPLISCASTTILFIFFIALGMTVYTKTSSSDQKQCFLSSSVLMFFVYFFLIFMFCTKTSVGYFNYLRFVRLFPQPPLRQLFTMLIISFFISITWVAFAAGFNYHSSFKITQLYPYKLCWFTLDVIYYFLTIPVCLFLLINIIFFILVATRIINHVRNATSPHQSYERMKRCVLVLLSSCLTQGIGWLFGVFLTFLNPTAGQVLGWIFVVFNGLEGLWAIMLYMIIRAQHMDEQKHAVAARKLRKLTLLSSIKRKKSLKNDLNHNLTRRLQTTKRDSRSEWRGFQDQYSIETKDRMASTC